jgi:DNA-binding NtrC family response regulator
MVSAGRPLCVLVVDDEALLLWSIAESLRQRGHTVLEATSAGGARDAMSSDGERIDVVLLDIRLPDSTDLQLVEEVRRRMPRTAIVLMTAYGTPEIADDVLALRVHAVLVKPFDLHALEPLLRNAHHAARPH